MIKICVLACWISPKFSSSVMSLDVAYSPKIKVVLCLLTFLFLKFIICTIRCTFVTIFFVPLVLNPSSAAVGGTKPSSSVLLFSWFFYHCQNNNFYLTNILIKSYSYWHSSATMTPVKTSQIWQSGILQNKKFKPTKFSNPHPRSHIHTIMSSAKPLCKTSMGQQWGFDSSVLIPQSPLGPVSQLISP